jgi:hypothetical protein
VLVPGTPAPLATDREALTPRHATDDPTEAALPRELLRTPRDQLPPRIPPRAARRALAPRADQRRRLVGDNVRLTNRLTRLLKHDSPHGLPWLAANDTPRRCEFLAQWPTLQAAQLARRATPERVCRAQHGRYTSVIAPRLQASKRAGPLTTAAGVLAPQALLVQALVAQRRVLLHATAAFDQAIAPRAQSHPDCPLCAARPGAGAVCAPRLLGAFGARRARAAAAAARQQDAGIAPVTERGGNTTWGHWRWQCPTSLRQTFVDWAAASLRQSCWARTDEPPQRDTGPAQQAAVRALAFTWIRLLLRGWQDRPPDAESVDRKALTPRGSPRLHNVAH